MIMGLFSARKRGNEAFRERSKMRRQAQREAASQPKPAPEPTPTQPEPEPEQPRSVPYRHSERVGSEGVIDTPDVATLADGGIVELRADIDEDSPTPPLPDAEEDGTEREAPAVEQPLGDLREVAERAANASTRVENGDMAIDLPLPPAEVREIVEQVNQPDTVQEKPFGAAELADSLRVPREWLTDVGIEPEPKPEPELEPEPEPTQSGKRSRGRPRPQETIDRDSAVYSLLITESEGISKAEIANVLREKEQQVYSSLRQLSKEGRAETRHVKDVGYRWFALTE